MAFKYIFMSEVSSGESLIYIKYILLFTLLIQSLLARFTCYIVSFIDVKTANVELKIKALKG